MDLLALFDGTELSAHENYFSAKDKTFIDTTYHQFDLVRSMLLDKLKVVDQLVTTYSVPNRQWVERSRFDGYIIWREDINDKNEFSYHDVSFYEMKRMVNAALENLLKTFLSRITDHFSTAYHCDVYLKSNKTISTNNILLSLDNIYMALAEELQIQNGVPLRDRFLNSCLDVFSQVKPEHVSMAGTKLSIYKIAGYTRQLIPLFSYFITNDILSDAGQFYTNDPGNMLRPAIPARILWTRTYSNSRLDIKFNTTHDLNEFVALCKLPI